LNRRSDYNDFGTIGKIDRAYVKRNMKTLTGHTPRVDVRAIRTERNKEGMNECRRRPRCIDDNNEAMVLLHQATVPEKYNNG
jgi:hypothetical protein